MPARDDQRSADDALRIRVAEYAEASTRLALLSDVGLGRMVDEAMPAGARFGGASGVLELDGLRVFAKKVPLTRLEQRPENIRSTANHFGLPGFYQYGVGSSGFGAWRELAGQIMASNWVLAGEHQSFPLLYHWRVLPGASGSDAPFAEFGGLEGAVRYWEGSAAVRARLEAIRDADASVVLFLEYVPQCLGDWLAEQDVSALAWVNEQMADVTAFMRRNGMVHFDAHFHNVLTDGRRVYVSDFGLVLSSRFELSDAERAFLAEHQDYDRAYANAHLISHLVPRVFVGDDGRGFLQRWTEGDRPEDVPPAAARLLDSHTRETLLMEDFFRRLTRETKQAPYPAAEIARLHASAPGPASGT